MPASTRSMRSRQTPSATCALPELHSEPQDFPPGRSEVQDCRQSGAAVAAQACACRCECFSRSGRVTQSGARTKSDRVAPAHDEAHLLKLRMVYGTDLSRRSLGEGGD